MLVAAIVLVLAGTTAACGGGGSTDEEPEACPAPPASLPPPTLPDGIPWPEGVVATDVLEDAKRVTVVGYTEGTVDEAVERFRSAFAKRSLLTLGSAEDGPEQTTLTIGGPSTQGTLTLSPGCDQVDVRLELRPLIGG